MRSKYPAGSGARYPRYLAGQVAGPALPSGVVQLPAALLGQGQPALDLLAGCLALHYRGVVAPAECQSLTQAVYAARSSWTENFDGIQFSLGRAWYVHLEQEQEDDYFEDAAASIARVEQAVPGLHARMAALVARLVGGVVVQRPGWCGTGVHIFPAGGYCAAHGGDVHFDVEGLSDDQLADRAPALTCVLMLQPAESGGALRVWERTYEGEAELRADQIPARGELCLYEAGDLVVIDSWRLHQIMPFTGTRDRISATLHAVYVEDPDSAPDDEDGSSTGRWEVWF